MSDRTWDMALTPHGHTKTVQFVLPSAIGRVIRERGLNRAVVSITDKGILIVPYEAESRSSESVEVPEWGKP